MKNKLLLLLVILFVSGCALEEMWHEGRSDAGRAFSVEQAKEFFETDYADMLTRSQGDDTRAGRFRGRMYPGDFTPLWDKAEYSESDGVAAYDIDILADRKVIAIRSKFGAGGAKAERLNVYQKLVVRRDVESGKMAAYVMSLIPDIGGDDRRIPERFRSRGKDKGGFCGIVVYATTDRGALVRVQEYKDGVLKRGVYIPSGKGSYIDRCVKAREILSGIALISKQCIRTKAGEDNWGDDYEDWYHPIEEDEWWVGNFTEIGYGVYTDGNGHYYIDNDGDGLIDEETIAPGYIEDEEPEDPWTEDNGSGNENGGDDGDNENEGNNEGGETGGDDNIDIGYGSDGNAGGMDGETSQSIDSTFFATTINNIKEKLADRLGTTRFNLSFLLARPEIGTLASMKLGESYFYDHSKDITIKVNPNLNETQLLLVIAHEFMHLILIEISRDAGSEEMLKIANRELWDAIQNYDNLPEIPYKTVNKYNLGHHEYMGSHIDEIESILREIFPGQDEKFYEYGKWGGGAIDSEAFNKLPIEERLAIEDYLRELRLYF